MATIEFSKFAGILSAALSQHHLSGFAIMFGISICKLVYIGQINKVLLYSTENYSQYPVINHNGIEYEKDYIYICITEPLCCIAEINKTVYINYT